MRTSGSSLRHDPVSMSEARRAFAEHPLASLVATGLGAGLSPIAPGTVGSAVALALAGLATVVLGALHFSMLWVSVGLLMSGLAMGLVGVAVSGPVCRTLGSKDPGCIVIDEVAGQLVAASPVPLIMGSSLAEAAIAWAASFLLFRFFDVVKPLGIGRLQELPGGWGVVADDWAGGLAAAALLGVAGGVASWLAWI